MKEIAKTIFIIFFVIFVIIPFAPITIPVMIFVQYLTKPKKRQTTTPASAKILTPNKPKYEYCYKATNLLTQNEYRNYLILREITNNNNLIICPKVRLADIVTPTDGPDYMALFGKIKSKHVDFVITDKDLNIKAILELDDNSHNRADRIERDKFVNELLTNVGYTVIRTRAITEYTLDPILPPKQEHEKKKPLEEIPKESEPEIKISRTSPTYEEWKAERLKQEYPRD